jgi:hypothetical protein
MQLELTDRKLSQKQRILNLLKKRGSHGAYNYEFSNDLNVLKYTNRLSELYKDGWNITHTKNGGSTLYVLKSEREFGDV